MTKGVLEVANAILQRLKKTYPEQLEYAQPEIPMKDLGLRVTLVDWSKAFKQKPNFGLQQAIVYSDWEADDEQSDLAGRLKMWTRDHPFTFSVLEAKVRLFLFGLAPTVFPFDNTLKAPLPIQGLEFDDVVVVFEKGQCVSYLAEE